MRLGTPPNLRVRVSFLIHGTSVYTPVRGTITFNSPATVTPQAQTDLRDVRVEGGARVLFDRYSVSTSPLRIRTLTVVDGTADCVSCTLDSVVVEPAGTLIVRPKQPGTGSLLGPTTIRGSAEFTEAVFGDAMLPLASSRRERRPRHRPR